jgi:5-methylcytosine-specific restriction enzyme A
VTIRDCARWPLKASRAQLLPAITPAHHVTKLRNLPSAIPTLAPRLRPPPKVAESFYTSSEWRGLVARIKRERGAWCVVCGSSQRVIADHIKERRDGGEPLDPANVQLLCQRCHNRKTARARAARAGA